MSTTRHPGFQTEVEFELPKGYVDETGTIHRSGTMRLATAADEILPLRDPRVQQNEAYLAVIVLARVVTRLGSLPDVHPGVVEGLYASDFAYLQRLYEQLNGGEEVEPELGALAVRKAPAGPAPASTLRRITAAGEA
jgi:hypothetical protein